MLHSLIYWVYYHAIPCVLNYRKVQIKSEYVCNKSHVIIKYDIVYIFIEVY